MDQFSVTERNIKMSKVFVGMLIAAAALTGCKTKSEKGGGAGNDTFKIVVPAMATDVKQGELQTVRVTLERGEGFKQQVKLELKAPAGIQVDPKDATVQPGDKGDVQVKITAAKDAPLGEQKIMVKGTPDKGEPTETEFKITVVAK
jgi:uncharacterized membrane protein